jgi:hypothetical protein
VTGRTRFKHVGLSSQIQPRLILIVRIRVVQHPPLLILPLLVLGMLIVHLGQFLRAFHLMFQLVILGGDITLQGLGAADLPLLLRGLLPLHRGALQQRTCQGIDEVHDDRNSALILRSAKFDRDLSKTCASGKKRPFPL